MFFLLNFIILSQKKYNKTENALNFFLDKNMRANRFGPLILKFELFHTDDQTPAVPGRADHIVKLSHKPSDS